MAVKLYLPESRVPNLINKMYRQKRELRNVSYVLSGVSLSAAGITAHNKDSLFSIIFGGMGVGWLNSVRHLNKELKILKPEYKEIIARYKQIKRNNKNFYV